MPKLLFACLFTVACAPLAWADDSLVVDSSGLVISAASPSAPTDPKSTVAGDFYIEPSTLHSIGFEWNILGDDNRDGQVTAAYRRVGDAAWRQGHDLLRIHGEKVGIHDPKLAYTCGNLYAGSILFLDAGTEYEVKLTLDDPDGGHDEKYLRVATKSLPRMPEGGRKLHVYPAGFQGAKTSTAFDTFSAAYAECQPGDQIVLHAGTYTGNFELKKSGTRERPIVVRAAGDGPVVFSGSGNLMDVTRSQYHWFHGLVFRGGAGGIYNGPGDIGTRGLTVTRCRFEDCYAGVFTRSTACRDLYIADNVFLGTQGTWHRSEKNKAAYKAVWLAGQGVDCCYNRITNLWDGLSTLQSPPTDDFARKLSAQDYFHNDVGQIIDDSEADYGQHNIRFFHNRLVDSHVGLSAQPFYGGPCYFVRNLQYNVTRGVVFKLEVEPAGVLIYNNTSISSGTFADKQVAGLGRNWSNGHIYNNLFLGLNGPTLRGGVYDPSVSQLDYNGYTVVGPVRWEFFNDRGQPMKMKEYKSLADFARDTGNEKHAVTISFQDLVKVPPPQGEAADTVVDAIDARLVKGSAAVDAGIPIPNVTDGFSGRAPDLGAYEFGQELPHYGPRP